MATFTSASDAMTCAAAIHDDLRAALPVSGEAVRVEIGAAAGEPRSRTSARCRSRASPRRCRRAPRSDRVAVASFKRLTEQRAYDAPG